MTLKEFFKWLLNSTEPELATVTRTEIPDGTEARRQTQEVLDKALAKEKADIAIAARLLETYFNMRILDAIKRHEFSISFNISLTATFCLFSVTFAFCDVAFSARPEHTKTNNRNTDSFIIRTRWVNL